MPSRRSDRDGGEEACPESAAAADPRPGAAAADLFIVRLEDYEGPLDALLELVKKQGLDITDLPLALVTDQFLAAIRRAEALDIEVNGEFALMAATLIQIKSKALLPAPPKIEGVAAEDQEEDLVQQLLEREKFLQAAEMLRERRVIEEHVWTSGDTEELEPEGDESDSVQVSLFDLVQSFGEVLRRLESRPVVDVPKETVSVASRIVVLRDLLRATDRPVRLREVLLRQASPRAVIATFLALLELVRAQAVTLRQERIFGEIVLARHVGFDAAFESGELLPSANRKLEYQA